MLGPRRLGRRGVVTVVVVLLVAAGVGGWLLTRPCGERRRRETITATVAAGSFEQTVVRNRDDATRRGRQTSTSR